MLTEFIHSPLYQNHELLFLPVFGILGIVSVICIMAAFGVIMLIPQTAIKYAFPKLYNWKPGPLVIPNSVKVIFYIISGFIFLSFMGALVLASITGGKN